MKTVSVNFLRFLSLLCLAVWAAEPRAVTTELDIHLYPGLTIKGAVGTVYSIEYVTDLTQTNDPSAWRSAAYPPRGRNEKRARHLTRTK